METNLDLQDAKNYINDQLANTDNVAESVIWLEGWICGLTDPKHGDLDSAKTLLIEYLVKVKEMMLVAERVENDLKA